MNHFAVHQKPTQYCKSTIFQFKNKKERTTKAKTGICIDTDLDVQIRLAFKRWNGLEVGARQKDTSFEDRQS